VKKAICKNKEKLKEAETTLRINRSRPKKLRKFLTSDEPAA
jgi:hypothetical protein